MIINMSYMHLPPTTLQINYHKGQNPGHRICSTADLRLLFFLFSTSEAMMSPCQTHSREAKCHYICSRKKKREKVTFKKPDGQTNLCDYL